MSISFARHIGLTLFAVLLSVSAFFFFALEANAALSSQWVYGTCPAGWSGLQVLDCDGPSDPVHQLGEGTNCFSASTKWRLCIDDSDAPGFSTSWTSAGSCPAGSVATGLTECDSPAVGHDVNANSCDAPMVTYRHCITPPSGSTLSATWSSSCPAGYVNTNLVDQDGGSHRLEESSGGTANQRLCLRNVVSAPAPSSYTLTVNSSGVLGVSITGSPSTYTGTTNYTRTVSSGTSLSLTAPATSGTGTFSSWSSCSSVSGRTCTVSSMSFNRTVTANYSVPSSSSANLVVAWIGGVSGMPGAQVEVEVQIFNYTSAVGPFEVAVNASSANNNCSTVDTGSFETHAVSGMSPGSLNLFSNELMLTLPSTPGNYTGIVMVDSDCQQDESNETDNTRTFTYTVTNPFDYILTNGGNKSVVQGQQVTNTITATLLSGTTQPISFLHSGLPAGASASFTPCSPSSGPTCSSTMTITTGASTPAGNSAITVTGTAGSVVHTTQFTLTVSVAQCNDGTDNDGDGLNDLSDPGCSSATDNDESDGTSQCQDNVDNDLDGVTDFSGGDFSCSSPQDNDETNPKAQCQDGIDNDSDGDIDFGQDPGCASLQDNNESDEPVITGTLTVNPLSYPSPLNAILTARIDSGYVSSATVNFSFWWNCDHPGTNISDVENGVGGPACGPLPAPSPTPGSCTIDSNGAKCDGVNASFRTMAHTYTNATQVPITVIPKVIIQHGSADDIEDRETVTVNPVLSAVSCSPPSINATRGASRTFTASGGSGNYIWSTFPSADCAETNGNTNPTYTVYCTSNGNREIRADDDDPNTPGDTCILKVGAPGFGEF